MKRTPFIAGNWKMHNTIAEAMTLIEGIKEQAKNKNNAEILVAPSFTALSAVAAAVKGTKILLAAQDMHYEEKGAFTGAVSPLQVKDTGATHVLVGHSERRSVFGDTNEIVHKKLVSALDHGLAPVLCIGETLEERESGKMLDVLNAQLDTALAGFTADGLKTLVIAYEPVWAIGTGKTATPMQAQEAHAAVRAHIAGKLGEAFAGDVRILYGGSVKTDNIDELMACPDVDGALVGGQSLKAEQFSRIIDFN